MADKSPETTQQLIADAEALVSKHKKGKSPSSKGDQPGVVNTQQLIADAESLMQAKKGAQRTAFMMTGLAIFAIVLLALYAFLG